jgi:hypothetical protein
MTVYDYRRPCYLPGRNTFVLRATVLCNQVLLAFQIAMLLTLPGQVYSQRHEPPHRMRGLAARLLVWLPALNMTRLSPGFPPCGEG